MITYERSKSRWLIPVAVVVAAGLAYGAYAWWGHAGSGDKAGVVLAARDKQDGAGWIKPTAAVDDTVVLNPPVLSDGRPSDVPPDDWAALNAVMKKVGAGKDEPQRIASYLRYQRGFESWQSLDETKDGAKRHSMARALFSELPDRLATGEFTPIEANLMSAVLLADIEPDEARRNQRLQEVQAKLNAISPMSEDEQQMQAKSRQIELKRRQATAFADWQAKTNPAEKTPAKLEQAMEEVRRAYNSGEF